MADGSDIEWTDATWNPISGCSVVSPGCTNCYAMRLAGTRLQHHPSRAGLTRNTKAGPVWTGDVRFNEQWLDQPLRWTRPRMIFPVAHGDMFHEKVPDAWIDKIMLVMMAAHWHTFTPLTKRADRMRLYLTDPKLPGRLIDLCWQVLRDPAIAPAALHRALKGNGWALLGIDEPLVLPNVWWGVSAEDQRRADERLAELLAMPAALHWVSAEPLLGPIDIEWAMSHPFHMAAGFLQRGRFAPGMETLRPLGWVVGGGESGPGARPMHAAWARSLRDQCEAAGVPYHHKQNGVYAEVEHPTHWLRTDGTLRPIGHGAWASDAAVRLVGKKAAGRLLDGREHNGMPGL